MDWTVAQQSYNSTSNMRLDHEASQRIPQYLALCSLEFPPRFHVPAHALCGKKRLQSHDFDYWVLACVRGVMSHDSQGQGSQPASALHSTLACKTFFHGCAAAIKEEKPLSGVWASFGKPYICLGEPIVPDNKLPALNRDEVSRAEGAKL